MAPFPGRKQRHAPTCTEGVEARPLQTSRRQKTDGVSCEDPRRMQLRLFMDLCWTPCEPDKWESSPTYWMRYTCAPQTRNFGKASTHVDGSGLVNGVDVRGFHKQHAWLVRNGLQGKVGLMNAAAAGGLWPAATLRADDRHDGLRQRCLAAVRWRRPCCTAFGSALATRRAAFSAQRRSGARKRKSRKMSLLASGCVASSPRPGRKRTCGPNTRLALWAG